MKRRKKEAPLFEERQSYGQRSELAWSLRNWKESVSGRRRKRSKRQREAAKQMDSQHGRRWAEAQRETWMKNLYSKRRSDFSVSKNASRSHFNCWLPVAAETSLLPATVRRRPAAPLLCSSLCTPGSTPAEGGTSAGHSARRTSWPWAWQTCGQWTRLYPEHGEVAAGGRGWRDKGWGVRRRWGRCSWRGEFLMSFV